MRRRSAASASRARVNSFSFTSNCWRAASHCWAETTWGFIANLRFVAVVVEHATSRRHPPVVVTAQPGPVAPEPRRLLAVGDRNQHIEMHVPAGGDTELHRAARQPA